MSARGRTRTFAPFVAALAALSIAACGKKDDSLTKKAGAKVGETLKDFTSGVGAGIDGVSAVAVELTQELVDKGLSSTVARWESAEKGLTVYLIAKDKLSATLVARALNDGGQEFGRSKFDASFDADDAKYVNFTFPPEMNPKLVAKYVIGLGK